MPLPAPKPRERKDAFVVRCMSNETMKKDFPKVDQRYAVCMQQWTDAVQGDSPPSGEEE